MFEKLIAKCLIVLAVWRFNDIRSNVYSGRSERFLGQPG